jgi:hypothetical protein
MDPEKFAVACLGGFDDALSGGPPLAGGGHEGAVLAAQDRHVRVRFVQVVVERGEEEIFSAHAAPPQPSRECHQEGRGDDKISSRSPGQNRRHSPSEKSTSTATYSSPP